MGILKPDLYFEKIEDIDISQMIKMGIKAILLDIDNTLTEHNNPVPAVGAAGFVKKAIENGMKVCIVSNNSRRRAEDFAGKMGVPFVYKARKPLSAGYKRAIKLLGVKKCEAMTVGDQVFTDIAGGRLFGILTVMVKPIAFSGETGFIRFKRVLEKPFVRKYY